MVAAVAAVAAWVASWRRPNPGRYISQTPGRAAQRAQQITDRIRAQGYEATAHGDGSVIRFSIGRDGWFVAWEWSVQMVGEKTAPEGLVNDMAAWAISTWEKEARRQIDF